MASQLDCSRVVQELAGAEGGESSADVHKSEKAKAGEQGELVRDPAESEAHEELKDSGKNRDGGLCTAHEVARDDGHERGLRDDAGKRAEKSKENLKENGGEEKRDERHQDVANGEPGHGESVQREAQALRQLADEQAAEK